MYRHLFVLLLLICFGATADTVKPYVKLNVPIVKQGQSLCGPATIESVFRYWGIHEYDQYDIAYNLLTMYPNTKRVERSGILDSQPLDWTKYPGTGTTNMRKFLKRFAATKNHKHKHLSAIPKKAKLQREQSWSLVKGYLSRGIPVIVHQYWRGTGSRGHYRIVTGYDEANQLVFLNDTNPGKQIVQTYRKFFDKWNVDQPWLHYNAIAFNIQAERPNVQLMKYLAGI